jgi:hypothetical protein
MEYENTQSTTFPDGRSELEQPKWRRDFPIDVAADEYGARRDFTKFMVLTSLACNCLPGPWNRYEPAVGC